MNRTLREATVKRYHYEIHDQLKSQPADFVTAYDFARRLKTLKGPTPDEFICKTWTNEPQRFVVDRTHQMPGLDTTWTSHEGGFPVPVRHAGVQSLSAWRSAAAARHVRRRPGLIDEDKLSGIEIELTIEPFLAPLQDVGRRWCVDQAGGKSLPYMVIVLFNHMCCLYQ